jgi:hypothetical protein
MGKGEGSRAEAEENDVSNSPKEDRDRAASQVGEVEARNLNKPHQPGR